jgi:hypothetical protein
MVFNATFSNISVITFFQKRIISVKIKYVRVAVHVKIAMDFLSKEENIGKG